MRASAAPGYTLLELMIVVTIVGMMASFAAPPFLRYIEQNRRLAALVEIESQFAELPLQARARGRDLVFQRQPGKIDVAAEPPTMSPLAVAEPAKLANPPEGWTITPNANIWIRYDGVCSGGTVEVRYNGQIEATYTLTPPFCTPVRNDARAR